MIGLEIAGEAVIIATRATRASELVLFYSLNSPGLVHLLDQLINLLLPVPQIAALNKVLEFPSSESPIWVAQFEGPQEIARLLEVWSHGVDLMNQILHTHDAILSQVILDNLIVGESNSLLVNLAVAAFVDKFTDSLQAWVAIGDVRFDDLEHFRGGFRKADKDAVIDLEKTKELESLAWFGSHLGDTMDCKLG